ncbi:ATP-binding cassette domain-containing protein [Ferrimonas marina]|uniref:Phosphonate transport system ATP-binding protein n=1 Tax=Ferrimonas marina TaxID=299255 RepID=A0A1M5SAJ0_9GAMM|nr:ATP-binding cassette domain-containing protein [Ferrimonas marina]SHH34923.1 phosphonate transport system ATP-binding protein [Ferrimonas marina]
MSLLQLPSQVLSRGGKPVLTLPALNIDAGERVALLGHSGVGKSTLLEALYRLQPKQVAWCPQRLGLVEPLSVYHNVYMGRLPRYSLLYNLVNLVRPWRKRQQEVLELLTPLGLDDKLTTPVSQLSGGQAQRTALGRALYQQRPIFLGDEPVTGIDPSQSRRLLTQLLQAHQTAVVALHDAELALACCDRILGLKQGQLQFDLASSQVTPDHLEQLYGQ